MDVPYIIRYENEYGLEFTLLLAEIDHAKLEEINHDIFEKTAKRICEEHGAKPNISYPKLRWDGKQLSGISMGVECACVGSEVTPEKIKYHFHNIDFYWQAMAALQILAEYANFIRKESEP